MRWMAAMLGAAVALLPGSAAGHDELTATRADRMIERAHTIDAVVDYAEATLTVRRTVEHHGARHDQAVWMLEVPVDSVATGLRTLGTLRGKPHWFEGDLLEAEYAAKRYSELTGVGGYYPKDPALLSWRFQGMLALQVFPVAPRQPKTVEYTLELPVRYEQGRYAFDLPPLGTADNPAVVHLQPAHRRDQLLVDTEPVGRSETFVARGEHLIELQRHDPPLFDARLAVASTGERSVVQYQLAVSHRVAELPSRAAVVVVLDTSRSMPEDHVEAAAGAADAYLSHFDARGISAKAEVLTFDREVHARHGGLRPVAKVRADLHTLTGDIRRNGSAVDDAIARAGKVLEGQPRSVERRIVVMTDARTRERLTPQRLEVLSRRTGALVHVGVIAPGSPELMRNDDHPWADVARSTGGLVWDASAFGLVSDPGSEQRDVYLEWARPVRVDHVTVSTTGSFKDALFIPDSLEEGFGTRELDIVSDRASRVVVSGELWARSVREVSVPDPDHTKLWSALVFGSELYEDLSEPEMMVLALRGGAVSPVTSYLAIEPGVRPSTEGLDDFELIGSGSGSGFGTIGAGQLGTIGVGRRPKIDPQAFLEGELRSAATVCGLPAEVDVAAKLQTTVDELVAIDTVTLRGRSDAVAVDCIRNQLWDVELPVSGFRAHAWKRWGLEV